MPRSGDNLSSSAEALAKTLFFVVGCQKSGTSWLQLMLDAHPQAICRGEYKLMHVLIPLMQEVVKCWGNHITIPDVSEDGDDFLSEAETTGLVRAAAGLLFAKWAGGQLDQIQAIGEKTPEHALTLPLLDKVFPGCRVIHIIRDGRDGIVSGRYHNLRENEEKFRQNFPNNADYARYFAEHHWVKYITLARDWGRAHSDRYLEVHYEALLSDPRPMAGRMLDFLGLDSSEASIETCLAASSFDAVTGGREHGDTDSTSHFRKGIAGDWVGELSEDEVRAFEEIAGWLMAELGYTSSFEFARSNQGIAD